MFCVFETIKPNRISDQIASQLRQLITAGKLLPGERLPTEPELAKRFSVSRASVREALFLLESEGLVERKKNGGTFIRRYSLTRLLAAVEFPAKMDKELFADLVESRERLELQAVELATYRADEMDFLRLERALEMMEQALQDGNDGVEADILFHQCIAVATKNQILAGLIRSIEKMMQETRSQTLSVPGRMEVCINEHRAIYEAILNRDAPRGMKLMQEHLIKVQEILKTLN